MDDTSPITPPPADSTAPATMPTNDGPMSGTDVVQAAADVVKSDPAVNPMASFDSSMPDPAPSTDPMPGSMPDPAPSTDPMPGSMPDPAPSTDPVADSMPSSEPTPPAMPPAV